MSPLDFKLSRPFESTRRASFPEPPSWPTLAGRIGYLYMIPEDRVAVTYADSDGDDITLSSDNELREHYQQVGVLKAAGSATSTIRFTVVDLGENAARRSVVEAARPRSSMFGGSAGTFGGPNFGVFGTGDNDWQRIGTLGTMLDKVDEGLHAYVETVPSEGSASVPAESQRGSIYSSTETDLGRIITPTLWKGKAREMYDSDEESTRSVLGMMDPVKLPLLPQALQNIPPPPPIVPRTPSVRSEDSVTQLDTALSRPVSTVAEPAPTVNSLNTAQAFTALEIPASPPTPRAAPAYVAPVEASIPVPNQSDADEPTLPHEEAPAASASGSLYNDLANFITSAVSVFAQHPELSEGLRNIMANATNGTYVGGTQAVTHLQTEAQRGIQQGIQEAQRGMQVAQEQMVQGMRQTQEQINLTTADAAQAAQEANHRMEAAMGRIFGSFSGTAAAPQTPETPRQQNSQQHSQPQAPESTSRTDDTRATRERFSWSVGREPSTFQPRTPFGRALNTWLDTVVPPTPGMQPPMPPSAPDAGFSGRVQQTRAPPVALVPPRPIGTAPAARVAPRPMGPTPTAPVLPRPMAPAPVPPQLPVPSPPHAHRRNVSMGRRAPPPPPSQQASAPQRQGSVYAPTQGPAPLPVPPSAPVPVSAREELERVKQQYKEAKARYRAEREGRQLRNENVSGDRLVLLLYSAQALRCINIVLQRCLLQL
jgi:hypothetical protein